MTFFSKLIKKNMNWIQWVLPIVPFTLILSILLLSFKSSFNEQVVTSVMDDFDDQMYYYVHHYEAALDEYEKLAMMLAKSCSESEDMFSRENVNLLYNACRTFPLANAYIKQDKKVVDQFGQNISKNVNKSVFQSFSDVIAETTDFTVNEGEERVALISAPIKVSSKVQGFIILELRPSETQDIIYNDDYVSTNIYALVAKDGVVVDRAGMEGSLFNKGSNIYEALEGYTYTEGSEEQIKSDLAQSYEGYVTFKSTAKNERYLFYSPVGERGSFFVMCVNSGLVEYKIDSAQEVTSAMVVGCFVTLGIFILLLLSIGIINATKHAQANKELRDKAETDLLTDLLNKIATEEKIREYLQGEGKESLSMMFVLDIDNFKNINDTMGHAFGDEVIASLGKQLKAEFRISDIVGRTGGDEFTIFLKDMKSEDLVYSEAERVLSFFKNFKVGEYTKYFATASIGAAIYPQDGDSFEDLYKAADQALYKAKNRGKNQMAFYKEKEERGGEA